MPNPTEHSPMEARTSPRESTFDADGSQWAESTKSIVEKHKHIIVLRGAGTNNGIDKSAAEQLLKEQLIPSIRSRMESGSIAIIFDGDGDDPTKPDVGYIMGRLRDEFASESDESVLFITAQKQSWYYPPKEGGNLANANGLEYKTFVFPDQTFPGDHNSFTQSEFLVNASGYEQWYVGASGPIASEQLGDFNAKVKEGARGEVMMFRAPINEGLTGSMEQKLKAAEDAGDQTKVEKLKGILEQRKNKFGIHWDNKGNLILNPEEYKNLHIQVAEEML